MIVHFEKAREFVVKENRQGTENEDPNILIHCANGSNRSATVVIALLMMIENVCLREAWILVKKTRKAAMPLEDNRRTLIALEEMLRGEKSSMSEADFLTRLEKSETYR
uniref:Tyrosine specific protein phosphatases domain-containing protein n=1 Tax=Odontella aurita TaxID=265563 RepID=A0A7S4JCR8_9STRA|mmetsp:Transcript_43440/g.132178  ORF Transcript_43440/g.132178 Transcript_43440/m.132178 type:complete len:109 (+) Transcript_43440:499-825(+)